MSAITITEIINDQSLLRQRQDDTTTALTSALLNIDPSSMKPKLIEWASLRFPPAFLFITVAIDVPTVCTDGTTRGLLPYVEFCLGQSIGQILSTLCEKFIGMSFAYSYDSSSLSIVISKL